MGFEQLLNRFWTDFGSILEAKLALKSMSKAIKTEVKTNIKKEAQEEAQITLHKAPKGPEVLTGSQPQRRLAPGETPPI